MTIDWEAAVRDEERLRALRESGLLSTGREDEFDRFVELAAELTGAACSVISLVESDGVYCKSSIGLPEGIEYPVSVLDTFCRYVIGSKRPFIVDDAANDSRVFGDPAIPRFGVGAWAGYPIMDPQGYILGTFCVIDTQARAWSDNDILLLATLAKAASTEIALRKSTEALARVRSELDDLRRRSSTSSLL